MAIRDVLMRGDLALTPSEEKIVRLLLTDYPTSGLGTASSLARRAGVSDPTVVRLVVKLGYEGFPDFQAKLLAEVEARLHSPLLMMEAKTSRGSAAPGWCTFRAIRPTSRMARNGSILNAWTGLPNGSFSTASIRARGIAALLSGSIASRPARRW